MTFFIQNLRENRILCFSGGPEMRAQPVSTDTPREVQNAPARLPQTPEDMTRHRQIEEQQAGQRNLDAVRMDNIAAEMNPDAPPDAARYQEWVRNSEQSLGIPPGTVQVSFSRSSTTRQDSLAFVVNGTEMGMMTATPAIGQYRQEYIIPGTVVEPAPRNVWQRLTGRFPPPVERSVQQSYFCMTPSGVENFLQNNKEKILNRARMSEPEAQADAVNIKTYNAYLQELLKDMHTGTLLSFAEKDVTTLGRTIGTAPLALRLDGNEQLAIACNLQMSPALAHRVRRPDGSLQFKFTKEGLIQTLRQNPVFLSALRHARGMQVLQDFQSKNPSASFSNFRFENGLWKIRTDMGWQTADADTRCHARRGPFGLFPSKAIISLRDYPGKNMQILYKGLLEANATQLS